MFKLLRFFSITSAGVVVVITLALGTFYQRHSVSASLADTELKNVALARTFANVLWPQFAAYVRSSSGRDGYTLRGLPQTREIHEILKTLTTGLPVLKVKIYNIDGLTVYSSQASQIGDDKSQHTGFLAAALMGKPSSKLSHRDTFGTFSGAVENRDLVETYIPIHGDDGEIDGVFELYTDVTSSVASIEQETAEFLAALLASFVLLYAALYLIIRRADRVLKQQYLDLQSNEQKIQAKSAALNIEVDERKQAEDALLTSEHTLRERVADLEEAQRKLEMQGESLVRLADDLLIARDEARAADHAKSEFLAAMSHELRTPLNAINGFSELIKDEAFGPVGNAKYRAYARDIHDSGQHLLGLINDILDLSKIESGIDQLHEDKIEIPEIVRSALKLVGQRAVQGGVQLDLDLAGQLPVLRADERKLKQILVNLLSNAVKFTEAGGEVTLRAWCRVDSGYVFQIVDTGIGIAPEDIPKALSHFGQVDSDLNRQYEGSGLGLPLTKALVEQHGGTLDIQSEVGVGTTVTVRFPAERIVASPGNADSLDVNHRAAS